MSDQGKKNIPNQVGTKVVQEFIEKFLKSFAAKKPFSPATKIGDRVIQWQMPVKGFFFIERGKEITPENAPEYIAVLKREMNADIELLRCESSQDETKWIFTAEKKDGKPQAAAIECTDEAAIGIMIGYLFGNGYIAGGGKRMRAITFKDAQVTLEINDSEAMPRAGERLIGKRWKLWRKSLSGVAQDIVASGHFIENKTDAPILYGFSKMRSDARIIIDDAGGYNLEQLCFFVATALED